MRIAICDDNPLDIEKIRSYVTEYFAEKKLKIENIALFENGEALLSDPETKDIVFLDMEMPGLDGVCVGKALKRKDKDIIIFVVTSYLEYLDEAMRFRVFRYLSKPLDKQRLFLNLDDALELYNSFSSRIMIESADGFHAVSTSDIVSVESHGHDTIVHTLYQDIKSMQAMRHWIQTLTLHCGCFFNSHRCFIVNLRHITDFNRSEISLCHGRFHAYLSRRKFAEFKNSYLLYLESTR